MGWLLACSGLRINPILLVMSCLAGRWCVLDINKSHPTGFEKLHVRAGPSSGVFPRHAHRQFTSCVSPRPLPFPGVDGARLQLVPSQDAVKIWP
jgi:hypothetical protein